jgi:hypothetical protein
MRYYLTYGNTPNYAVFAGQYADEFGPDHVYKIRNDPYYGSGDLTCEELYEQLERACEDWELNANEQAGDFACNMLSGLHFEWI